MVRALEGDEEAVYAAQDAAPEVEAIAADKREHAEIWKRLDGEPKGNGRRQRTRRASASDVVTFTVPTVNFRILICFRVQGRIVAEPQVGGLHHRDRRAA